MPGTILVVDDDLATLRALCAALETAGRVLAAEDATVALQYVEAEPVDLLVADLHLPDLNGIDLIARARERRPNLYSILLTAQAEPHQLIAAINEAEIYRFLSKPLDLDDLARTAQRALEVQGLHRERDRLLQELQRSQALLSSLLEASRELARASGRAEIVTATFSHVAPAVPFDLGAVLLAPPPGRQAALYLHAQMPLDEATLVSFKERSLAELAALSGNPLGAHEVKLILLGDQIATTPVAPTRAEILATPLEAGGEVLGVLQLLRSSSRFAPEERTVLGLLSAQAAQALRRDEALLQSQRRQLDLLLSSMADGVVMTSEESELALCNPAARKMLGVNPDETVSVSFLQERLGFSPFDLLREWERQGVKVVRERLELSGRTLQSLISPVFDGSGSLSGLSVVLRDVTAERELERRKDEFVSIVSHELRTPLASLGGSLDLVLRGYVGEVTAKQAHYLEMARDSCQSLHRIVDDLLDLSKFESGMLEVAFEEVDLAALIREVVQKHEAVAVERGLELRASAKGEALVAGDSMRLNQVLNNLLANALKFTPQGGTIEVSLLRSDALLDHVGISVLNTGSPIDEGDLERIFEKFKQSRAAKGSIGGTGLGLAIARGLVESHGGRLWAENDPAPGVRFLAVFPKASDSPGPPGLDERAQAAATAAHSSQPPHPVLVADRDPATAALLKGVLLRYGFPALTAASADQVLALARRRPVSVLALDPAVWGDEAGLGSILAHDPETQGITLLSTSATGPNEGRHGGFVERPFTGASFVLAVAEALRGMAQARARRILVVDPDEAARLVASEALARAGHEVRTAARAEDAYALGRGAPPDLVVLDVALPDGDGFELARTLGAGREGGPALIFVTSRATLAHKVRAFREGAADYLVKPVDPAVLVDRARAAMRGQAQRDTTLTTRLPGSVAVERELRRRLAGREAFACIHITVDGVKEFGQAYGFGKADGVVQQIGSLAREVLSTRGAPDDFAGHLQRDHFVVVSKPERADLIGDVLFAALNRVLPLFYDQADRDRGYLNLSGPDGTKLAALMSACVVLVIDPGGRFVDPPEITAAARTAKLRGKPPGQPALLWDKAPG